MAHALPVSKLAGLFIKTLSKPLSKRIKHDFSRYQATQRLLVEIGQLSHKTTSYMTIWSAGHRVRSITPLEEAKAMSIGAEFVGESFVLAVSMGVVLYEYNRGNEQKRQDQMAKSAQIKAEQETLRAKFHTLDVRMKALEAVVKTSWRYKEPSGKDIVPIDDNIDDLEEQKIGKQQDTESSSDSNNGLVVVVRQTETIAEANAANDVEKGEKEIEKSSWWARWWSREKEKEEEDQQQQEQRMDPSPSNSCINENPEEQVPKE